MARPGPIRQPLRRSCGKDGGSWHGLDLVWGELDRSMIDAMDYRVKLDMTDVSHGPTSPGLCRRHCGPTKCPANREVTPRMSLTLYLAYVAACIVIVVVPGPTVTLIVLPLRPSSTSAMSARPAAGNGRMCKWGQFCTLSSQAPSRETRRALGALNRSAIGTQSLPIHGAGDVRYLRVNRSLLLHCGNSGF